MPLRWFHYPGRDVIDGLESMCEIINATHRPTVCNLSQPRLRRHMDKRLVELKIMDEVMKPIPMNANRQTCRKMKKCNVRWQVPKRIGTLETGSPIESDVEMSTQKHPLGCPLYETRDKVGKRFLHDKKYVNVFELPKLTYFWLSLRRTAMKEAYSAYTAGNGMYIVRSSMYTVLSCTPTVVSSMYSIPSMPDWSYGAISMSSVHIDRYNKGPHV